MKCSDHNFDFKTRARKPPHDARTTPNGSESRPIQRQEGEEKNPRYRIRESSKRVASDEPTDNCIQVFDRVN